MQSTEITYAKSKITLFMVLILCALTGLSASLFTSCRTNAFYARKLLAGKSYSHTELQHAAQSQYMFHYQEASAPDLQWLQATYIPRELQENYQMPGKEVETIIALLHIAYALAPWDGTAPWPEGILSTPNIINYANRTKSGVNCRMKAIILQELCLSMGIPARIVSCIPLDPKDTDSHVVTAVWSSTLQKWLLMDPSFNAYVLDHQGQIMSIEEVREGLIKGSSYFLNAGAEAFGKPLTEKFYLSYYMTKNLYALMSPLQVEYGLEGSGTDYTQILLVPACEVTGSPEPTIKESYWRGSRITTYILSNSELFWASPYSL